ncbi:MAG: CD225/dispanin family protein [Muribaculaceae bacterium]|nr:CD225/dispanin family protein [Muribaculaceae bacterium]
MPLQPQVQQLEKPKSHLLAAILVTIFCCTIPGVIAIVFGSSVSSRLAMGDYEGAMKASRRAEGWIIAGFVLGLLSTTIYLPIMLVSSMI